MKISTPATMLALGLALCACGETDDPAGEDAGSIAPPSDGGQVPRDSGGRGQGHMDAAGDPGGPDDDAGQQAPQDAGNTPADSGTGAGEEDGSAPEDAGRAATTFTEVYEILSSRCTPCHTALTPRRGGLDLASKATAYSELVGKGAEGPMCAGRTRVVAGDPDGSLLIQKLRGTQDCGDRMPAGGNPPLSPSSIDVIADWIEAGALND